MTTRQTKAIAALVSEPTKRAAAEKAGISESTLRSYLQDPSFQEAYKEAFSDLMVDATRQAQRNLSPALSTLREIVEDEDQPATARISTARSLLEYGLKLSEYHDIAAKMQEIEKIIKEMEGAP